ncbi:biotin--[acetyl-CoA-carboxylase] ligase [Paenalcaligenes niemegkensis]|uniref:biotin--[acetyl-CoA-carboxylase] ligase n=1 Tax=Paenalcaligenes niemegkensis TaxID=2895469 RepID=UPI001EE81EF6|nr:biotin--[acetyl-CoA-carboxylase] ligase [Paenalcaligenes niemegkensis]MCQ9617614.1 biotin--[acetyl-CoA-carboxylase] ligase [Paenalcaligenes niemegkensis]
MSYVLPPLGSANRMASQLEQSLNLFNHIEWVERTDSTNGDLIQRARSGSGSIVRPWLLGAHLQDRGRGRAGRTWQNRAGSHLMFSCAFDIFLPARSLATLSPLAGVAACEALRRLLPARHQVALALKWPNDILWYGAKLAGILTEVTRASTAPSSADHHVVVIGIGINLDDARSLSQSLNRQVADWSTVCQDCPDIQAHRHADLVANIARAWYETMNQTTAYGFDNLSSRYAEVDALSGQNVSIIDNGRTLYSGIASGINETGQLLVRSALGCEAISVGEVSVRPTHR